jgi:hypothetical protein
MRLMPARKRHRRQRWAPLPAYSAVSIPERLALQRDMLRLVKDLEALAPRLEAAFGEAAAAQFTRAIMALDHLQQTCGGLEEKMQGCR